MDWPSDLKGQAVNPEGNSKAALVSSQMNKPLGPHARVTLTGLRTAEYFGGEAKEGHNMLLFIDTIFRLTRAGSKVSTSLSCIPPLSAIGRPSPALIRAAFWYSRTLVSSTLYLTYITLICNLVSS